MSSITDPCNRVGTKIVLGPKRAQTKRDTNPQPVACAADTNPCVSTDKVRYHAPALRLLYANGHAGYPTASDRVWGPPLGVCHESRHDLTAGCDSSDAGLRIRPKLTAASLGTWAPCLLGRGLSNRLGYSRRHHQDDLEIAHSSYAQRAGQIRKDGVKQDTQRRALPDRKGRTV